MRNKQIGSCFCNNISFVMELTQPLNQYNPRECDCDFCQKHGSAAISDKDGTLDITIKDLQLLSKFRQGSNLAEFLICKICGVFVAVCYDDYGKIYGAINSRTVTNKKEFGSNTLVSPEKLSNDEKIQRWKMLWFPNVHIENDW
jgi:hypothetical protein